MMFPPPPPPYPASWDTTGRPPVGPGVPYQGGPNFNYMGNDLKGAPQFDGGGNFHSPYPPKAGKGGKKGQQPQGKGPPGQGGQGEWEEGKLSRKQRSRAAKAMKKAPMKKR